VLVWFFFQRLILKGYEVIEDISYFSDLWGNRPEPDDEGGRWDISSEIKTMNRLKGLIKPDIPEIYQANQWGTQEGLEMLCGFVSSDYEFQTEDVVRNSLSGKNDYEPIVHSSDPSIPIEQKYIYRLDGLFLSPVPCVDKTEESIRRELIIKYTELHYKFTHDQSNGGNKYNPQYYLDWAKKNGFDDLPLVLAYPDGFNFQSGEDGSPSNQEKPKTDIQKRREHTLSQWIKSGGTTNGKQRIHVWQELLEASNNNYDLFPDGGGKNQETMNKFFNTQSLVSFKQ
jgi:hypothetical protein